MELLNAVTENKNQLNVLDYRELRFIIQVQ